MGEMQQFERADGVLAIAPDREDPNMVFTILVAGFGAPRRGTCAVFFGAARKGLGVWSWY